MSYSFLAPIFSITISKRGKNKKLHIISTSRKSNNFGIYFQSKVVVKLLISSWTFFLNTQMYLYILMPHMNGCNSFISHGFYAILLYFSLFLGSQVTSKILLYQNNVECITSLNSFMWKLRNEFRQTSIGLRLLAYVTLYSKKGFSGMYPCPRYVSFLPFLMLPENQKYPVYPSHP